MWMFLSLIAVAEPALEPDVTAPGEPAFELDSSGKPEGELPVRVDPVRISCCIGREFIEAPIRASLPEVRACWSSLPPPDRAVPVRRRIEFSVATGSRVPDAVHMQSGEHPVDACLVEVFARLEWPASAPCRWRTVYPYAFEPAPSNDARQPKRRSAR